MLVGAAPVRRAPVTADGDERPMTGTRILASILAVASAVLVGCSSSGGSGGPSPAASTSVITIRDFQYTTPASVSPGATITVKNQDDTEHTVTADTGNAFDDHAPTGESTFTAPTRPGSYPFHCTFHPEMRGTLVVR
jgi:plastocyanin